MSNLSYDTVVVGGGVIGSSIAFQLAKRGARVLMLEKERIAGQASGAAAGMLGAQSEFSSDSPVIPLALKSRAMFPELAEELRELTGIDIGLVQKGLIKIAFSNEEVEAIQQHYQFWKSHGSTVQWLTLSGLRELEPYVTGEVAGAMYLPDDGQVRADDLSLAFAKAASVYGVEIKQCTDVVSFVTKGGRIQGVVADSDTIYSDVVVVAAGAWSANLLKKVNLNLKMYPVKGECFSVITDIPLLQATIFAQNGCYIVPKKGNRLLIGATSIPKSFDKKVTVSGIYSLLERAQALVPKVKEAHWERAWCGIRPQTDDGLPYIGEHPQYKGLWVATGHYRNGILLSPITGVLLADLIEGKRNEEFDLSSFRLTRNDEVSITK